MRIAICDDNSQDTQFVKEMTTNWANNRKISLESFTFLSAEIFLFHYEEDKNFDILLLDVEMGKMDGVTMAKQIRQDNEAVQIIFITGYSDYISEGYKDLGEDGVEVSGGEAQKIAIARALYKDAPFIILDEPTAALDPIAEAEIYAKFNDISGDKTTIYISHRLSSCKFCDEIAVFHDGSVIQQGSHEALLSDKDGMYYALWTAQAQYYTES